MPGDVVVVGSGPNGLAAAVLLARAGLRVEVREGADQLGGGMRSKALFDSGIVHDVCSAVHPLAVAGRFFREFDLPGRGVEMCQPEIAYGHPLDGGRAALAYRSLDRTCEALGLDGPRYRMLMAPLVAHSRAVADALLSDLRSVSWALALLPFRVLAAGNPRFFRTEEGKALLTGVAAHTGGRLPRLPAAGISLLLGHLAHTTGWPVPRGGSQRIANALADDLLDHRGIIHIGQPVTDLRELGEFRAVLLDIGPRNLLDIAGNLLPDGYRRALEKYRYGPGSAKVDFLVSEPVPWANPELSRAGTVHVCGDQAAVYASENATVQGQLSDEPYVLVTDPMVADPSRGLPGKRPVWAYCHVPNGDPRDVTGLIRRQIERFAPGFSDTILASRGTNAVQQNEYNPNYVGGDVSAGALDLRQVLARPALRWNPYRTPLNGVYLCSAATPPGPAVHGMGGYHAAKSVLRDVFGISELPSLAPDEERVQ
ncbi:phytoene desaturase family protein [Amycolatopsis alkalitolerans]|uniref:NAD(P)/FAD-dependent oxidoreductase n=1 Tax=Amycolatopsis alkalitolerans TaxID=2547244 RepID=A0A5C4M8R5_9PSEU|nr:NAD(P)/FAD-dependent oxidoreductase [Amycolatopsis alkalitolerans]TNC29496.1 NAD(P)/FAD-dependent oxidoreductase [Amycolatopsis alkalitolerans]